MVLQHSHKVQGDHVTFSKVCQHLSNTTKNNFCVSVLGYCAQTLITCSLSCDGTTYQILTRFVFFLSLTFFCLRFLGL